MVSSPLYLHAHTQMHYICSLLKIDCCKFLSKTWCYIANLVPFLKENLVLLHHLAGQVSRRNSSLDDTSRAEYLHASIGGLLDAIRNGSNTRGYFVWSFLDVFELLDGRGSSYGLYFVDLDDPSLRRLPKKSAHWYSHFLKGGRVSSNRTFELEKTFVDSSSETIVSVGLGFRVSLADVKNFKSL
ncbi:beta-glucosidase 10-like [Hevea brasiliensis]|uniref:beta-glucosidase 10-like n=1 Tax=Hevea brasiliensis TaxID=3981 RepID=UPI0025DD441E|nr:beta-glucosidase 10-like [Hevea brasiliensis]